MAPRPYATSSASTTPTPKTAGRQAGHNMASEGVFRRWRQHWLVAAAAAHARHTRALAVPGQGVGQAALAAQPQQSRKEIIALL